jgi:2-(1,2-epoxy-1,2-dihydrophenyl)acetyl-CoA isomerase
LADSEAPLLIERDEHVVTLTLNRPDRLNAMNAEMRTMFTDALDEMESDPGVRAVILTGAGRGFCAGGDVGAMTPAADGAAPQLRPLSDYGGSLSKAIRAFSRPVIAAVNGPAAGAGLDIALACDIRIASSAGRFATSFVRIGLVPDGGGMYLLPRVVGVQRACELIFSGRTFGADEALQYGVVLEVSEPADLLSRANAIAATFSANAPLALQLAKSGIYRAQESGFAESFDHVSFAQTYLQHTADHAEGIRAFVEKRQPQFTGA